MDPLSIAAIATGATAFIASVGSCLAPLFRKQQNSVNQTSIETDQDVVTVSYGGDTETTWSCWGWTYSKKQTPMLVFNSKEINSDHDIADAYREARGYKDYASSQPRITTTNTIAGEEPPAHPLLLTNGTAQLVTTNSSDIQRVETVIAGDDELLGNVDRQYLYPMGDKRNHYDIEEIIYGSDGSFSIKGIKADVSPSSDGNVPKHTQIGKDITIEVLAPIKAMVAALTKQKLLHAARETLPTNSDSESAPLLSPISTNIQLTGGLHQDEEG